MPSPDLLRSFAEPGSTRLADVSTVDFVMRLQRMVGNASLQRLLQRDPKLGWDPSRRHRTFARTHHTDPNRVVEKGGVKLRNVLLQGLTHGYNDSGADDSDARGDTVEDAAGKAVVWLPETFKPNGTDKPVEVLLHMHGYGAGYRELASGSDYADNLKPGQTRDEDLYKLPDQLSASMKDGSRQVVAVLPQGRARPEVNDKNEILVDMFGDIPNKPDAYLDEVFAGLQAEASIDKPGSYQLVMSGHSGSGRLVMQAANKLESKAKDGVDETAGGSKVTLAEIVLFDAIHKTEINTVETWLRKHIQDDLDAFNGKPKPGAAQLKAYFSKRTRFRGYYSANYEAKYKDLRKILSAALSPVRGQLGDVAQTWFEWQYLVAGPIGTKAATDNDFAVHERLLAGKNDSKKAGLVDEMLDLTSIPPSLASATPPPTKAPPTTPPPTKAPPTTTPPTTTPPTTTPPTNAPANTSDTEPAAPAHRLVDVLVQRDPRRRRRRRNPSGSTSSTTRKPKFTLTGIAFVVDGTSVNPARGTKTGGWTFASSGTGAFAASRRMPRSTFIAASGADTPLQEQTTVHVAGTSATVDALNVVLSSGTSPQLTISLDSSGRGTTKPVAVGPEPVQALDLTLASGFTPHAGDTIQLLRSTHVEVFVFSSLKDPSGKSVEGFFDLGRLTKIQGGFGVEGRDAAPFDSTFTNLDTQKRLSAAAVANQDIFSMTSEVEGGFATVQSADIGVLSFGFGQWTAMSDLPQMLKRIPAATFQQHLGQYGLSLGTPTLGAFAQARKFIPGNASTLNAAVRKLSLRNTSEGCLLLDGKELVSEAMHKTAADWSSRHQTVLTSLGTLQSQAAALQADIASGNAAKASAARTQLKSLDKEVNAAWKKLAGLPGIAARVPTRTSLDARVNTLIGGVTAARAAADQVVNNTGSVELLRTNEWVLRFQVAGEDPTVQTAEVEEAEATLDAIDARTFGVTNGVSIGKLFPSHRAQALLFSTFLNSQRGITLGVPRAITAFKNEQVAAAPASSQVKKDWQGFVWPQSDARWARLFTNANQARLEELAEDKLLPFTFDPDRRKGILARRFPN
jgi:hypothetical protein